MESSDESCPHIESGADRVSLPLLEESVEVDKRQVATGKVRVSTVVSEHHQMISQHLQSEDAEIKRVPKNEPVSAPPSTRTEGDTTIVPILEEVLVVEKRLVLKEEIHIRKRITTTKTAHPVTLRAEDVVIEHDALEHDETRPYSSNKE